jgi:hypothetical protein
MSQGDFPGVELRGGPCEERAPTFPGGHFERYFPASGKSAHIRCPATEIKPGGTRQSAHELPVAIGFIPTEPVVEMNDADPLYSKGVFKID